MAATDFSHPAIGAALTAAATLLRMQAVFVGELAGETFTFARTQGRWPGLYSGMTRPRADSFCDRMLAGAPATTSDAANDAAYASSPLREEFGITSYVGVPVVDADGPVLGTLCGIDSGPVAVDSIALAVLRELAVTIACVVAAGAGSAGAGTAGAGTARAGTAGAPNGGSASRSDSPLFIERTARGWSVGGEEAEELVLAMVLADLMAGELPPGRRPERIAETADEASQLRVAVAQLEHALTARVTIEQGIGVVAERFELAPRDAFELLRSCARRGGRRVHDVAAEVVRSSSTDVPTLAVPLRRR